ncbi:MAG: monovalent cation/H(+) antiporter subunit G [Candidatus Izimaplasma sp.]|nr:monovalent cation/H(+) antiporter subunit G [Candidatus Izimaplasma bacterium]
MEIISYIFLIIGGLFYLLGGLGILRMPDVFNRIQAGTKATTLGAFSVLIGVMIAHPEWWLKLLLIIIFIVLANPIGSSVLAKAAYLSFDKPKNLVIDQLQDIFGGEDND